MDWNVLLPRVGCLLALFLPTHSLPAAEPAAGDAAEYVKVLRRMTRLSRAFAESDYKLVQSFALDDEQRAKVGKEYDALLKAYDVVLHKMEEGTVPTRGELLALGKAEGQAERNVKFALGDKSVNLMQADRPRYDFMRIPHGILWGMVVVDATPDQMVKANALLRPMFDIAAECPPTPPADGDRTELRRVGERANEAMRQIGPELRKVLDEKQWKRMAAWNPVLESRHLGEDAKPTGN